MASEGPLSPGAVAGTGTGGGATSWLNPLEAQVSDDVYAQLALPNTSVYLKATNFGFAVPDVEITGIEVEVERSEESGAAAVDSAVRIVKGGAVGTTDRAVADEWPLTDTYQTYGGPTDLWGETWSAADINASDFGAAVSVTGAGSVAFAQVDHIQVTVYFDVVETKTVDVPHAPTTKRSY